MNPPQFIIRLDRGDYYARLHTNAAGRQVTWTSEAEATRFATEKEAFDRAVEHGLKPFTFYVEQEPKAEAL